MDDIERKPLLHNEGACRLLPTGSEKLDQPTVEVDMPDMFTDGDQGPINQVILSTIGATTDDQGAVIDGSVSGTFVADASTLQNLIASGTVQLTDASGQPLQLVRLTSTQQTPNTTVASVSPTVVVKGENMIADAVDTEARIMAQLDVSLPVSSALDYGVLNATAPAVQNLPPGTPLWAARLRDCQKIGDFYRGWVETEVELDIILTLHKQHTQSLWGTRQSPCPNKPATRLMWKSQYVPFDGMPFLNAGSRAIVMECQFGPRRKGSQSRKDEMAPLKSDFKQTCPARIYIKKVKKFVDFQINDIIDKKQMKIEMDRAFQAIREKEYKFPTQERYYVQLPTLKAHEYHCDRQEEVLKAVITGSPQDDPLSRLHPLIIDKIREFVSQGETRLYVIRKQLRKYVEKELFEVADNVPDKHNLQFFPTVNDLQNHIHQAAKDMESGMLSVSANALNMDMLDSQGQGAVWQMGANPHAETVTVTITQNPEGESHVISKVETHLSDGSTQVTENLNTETARLLAKLHPTMFQSVSPNLEEPTTIRIQVPVSSSTTAESVLPMQPEATLLTPSIDHQHQALGLAEDDQSTYTVVQGSNGALFLTKAGGVLTAEEECASSILPEASGISLPTAVSTVRDMDHSGVLTIVENDLSQTDSMTSGLTGDSNDVVNNHHSSPSVGSQLGSLGNTVVADTLNGECSFTTVTGCSAFHPVIQEAAVDYPSSDTNNMINTNGELDVGHLTEGVDMLVSEEVGVITQADHSASVIDYRIVSLKSEQKVDVVI